MPDDPASQCPECERLKALNASLIEALNTILKDVYASDSYSKGKPFWDAMNVLATTISTVAPDGGPP
jgi:hypothetical protein